MRIKTIASSSSGCCYVIESGNEQLIIEMGVSVKKLRQALNFDLSSVVGCLVSHSHSDHSKFLPDLEKVGIPIWCTDETKKVFKLSSTPTIEQVVKYEFSPIFGCNRVKLKHDCDCYGFIVDTGSHRLGYFTDTGHARFKVPGLTHLMIEANHSFESLIESESNKFLVKRISDYHLSIEDVVDFCTRHKDTLQEIHLIHLSDTNANEVQFQELVAGATGVPVYISRK